MRIPWTGSGSPSSGSRSTPTSTSTEDMESTQKARYVAQVLEKVIFGDLLLEREHPPGD